MPNKGLTVNTVIEKNKLASDVPFIALLEIQVMDSATQAFVETIRLANNSEDVVFNSQTYTRFHFDMELKQQAGSLPEVSLKARDFENIIMSKLDQYGGAAGSIVTLRVVNAANLAAGVEVEETFELLEASANDYMVSFSLGVESSLRKMFPRRTQMRDRCAWKYKGAECGYTGPMPTCDLTLQGPNGCEAHSNSINFGGMPGLVTRGVAR